MCCDNSNLTEHIIQNIFLNTLMKFGFYCQKEVVMPVLVDNMFVGHNRFDIMVTGKKRQNNNNQYRGNKNTLPEHLKFKDEAADI